MLVPHMTYIRLIKIILSKSFLGIEDDLCHSEIPSFIVV